MKKLQFIKIIICTIFLCNSCKDFDADLFAENELFRIKRITEFDENMNETSYDFFDYEDNKLIFWQHYIYTVFGEMIPSWKVEVTYCNDKINAAKYNLRQGKWELHQKCEYTIYNNQVIERIISRASFPQCDNCWKYRYIYCNSRLVEQLKYIKNENGNWEQERKDVYTYNENSLQEYRDYIVTNDTVATLDYFRKYITENNSLKGWLGGVCVEGEEWQPTNRMDYIYEMQNLSEQIFSVFNNSTETWIVLGKLQYIYDENNNLTEEISSAGTRLSYEYEKGPGNAELIYCEPKDKVESVLSEKNE